MALITLSEAKEYLRVDSADEDVTIGTLLLTACVLTKEVGRITDRTWERVEAVPDDGDNAGLIQLRAVCRVAALYMLGYLFEHRDEADHQDLTLTLRALLFSVREGGLV